MNFNRNTATTSPHIRSSTHIEFTEKISKQLRLSGTAGKPGDPQEAAGHGLEPWQSLELILQDERRGAAIASSSHGSRAAQLSRAKAC